MYVSIIMLIKKIKMSETLEKTFYEKEQSFHARLASVIEAKRLKMTPERFDYLVKIAEKLRTPNVFGEVGLYDEGGLRIKPPDTDRDGKRWSLIDFQPPTDAFPRGAQQASRGELSRLMLEGLHGLQDYALLVEGGFIEKPDMIIGTSNRTMTRLAVNRMGFKPMAEDPNYIEVAYTDLQDMVFSPETAAMETRLLQFQARHDTVAQVVGPVAVAH